MAGKKNNAGGGEGSKKAQGQSRKAEQANKKAAAENAKLAAVEDAEWEKGAKKGSAKKETAEEKKAEAARKKAERDALLAEEEKSLPSRAAPKNAKTAVKKTKGIDQALGEVDSGPLAELNATGINNALDALSLDDKSPVKIDRHPEKRSGARNAWQERRLKELQASDEWAELKKYKHVREARLNSEWKKAPENPKNQLTAKYNTTKEEMREMKAAADAEVEQRLATK